MKQIFACKFYLPTNKILIFCIDYLQLKMSTQVTCIYMLML